MECYVWMPILEACFRKEINRATGKLIGGGTHRECAQQANTFTIFGQEPVINAQMEAMIA